VIAGTTRVTVVIGDPVEHSRSPAMLNAAYAALGLDFVMVPLRVAPANLDAAVRGLAAAGVVGASVTVPHKAAVIASCTRLTEAGTAIGAVNCLAFDAAGGILGDNTDGVGFVEAVAAAFPGAGILAAGHSAVLLGAGGAARAVAAALTASGLAVTVIARRPEPFGPGAAEVVAWEPAALAAAFATAALIVDCTPIALDPAAEPAFVDALPLDALPTAAVVASLVYHREPLLLNRARARGHRVIDGRGMLVHQGARAFARWTRRPAPVDVMQRALDASLSRAGG
jgi:shikimate dehydrogenase